MNLQPLLAFIRSHEAPKGYNQVWSGIKKQHLPPRPLTQMTIREILRWQDSIDALYRSEAAGAYQFMEDTLRAQFALAGLGLDQVFDADAQDQLAIHLMRGRGLNAYVSGHMTAEQFSNSLAKEWASLPVVTPVRRTAKDKSWVVPAGASYYSGDGLNAALTPVGPFLAAVRAIKASGATTKPKAPPTATPPHRPANPAPAVSLIGIALAALAYWWAELAEKVGAWIDKFLSMFGG